MHISHTKSFNIHLSIALATLAHMINVYEICRNKLSNIQYGRFQILPMDLPFWTVLVSWYPHHAFTTLYNIIIRASLRLSCRVFQPKSSPQLYHPFVDPICSFVTSQLKVARKHTSQPDYLRIFRQLVHELAGRLTV